MHHFVLKDDLKINAIYYGGDTFDPNTNTSTRATYGTLLAVILHAGLLMFEIVNSCYRQISSDDSDATFYLLEAHVFDEIAYSKDMKEMRIFEKGIDGELTNAVRSKRLTDADKPAMKQEIKKNARDFASRNGIKLVWMD